MSRPLALLVIALPLLGGCSENPTAGDEALMLRSDKASYNLREAISVLLRNQTSSTAYFKQCNGRIAFRIQRSQEMAWAPLRWVALECVPLLGDSPDTALAPGASYSDSLSEFVIGNRPEPRAGGTANGCLADYHRC